MGISGMRRAAALAALAVGAAWGAAGAAAQELELRRAVRTDREIVVTANPLATEAGRQVLRDGGNAVDAAVAIEAVLGLVEPQSSGLGGGGFLVHYDARSRRVTTYDGRETAPAGAGPRLFLQPDGTPLDFSAALRSGRSVGVPGTVRLFEAVLADHGTLPLETLFRPAAKLASQGFEISPRLAGLIAGAAPFLAEDPGSRAYFLNPDGSPKAAGTRLVNRDYALTLNKIARRGATDAFYAGPIGRAIVEAVQNDDRPGGPGSMTIADLRSYQVLRREPVCGGYRAYLVCGMGPPSSGGVATLQILGLLERFDLAALGPRSPRAIHYFLQANRLAFADRNQYLADPGFVAVPTAGLIDERYLDQRARLIVPGPIDTTLGASAGVPPGSAGYAARLDASPPRPTGTSHVSIVDAFGNAVAMTMTIESGFGNFRLVEGFLLNNELTDFSFDPGTREAPVANRVEPGKRPRSSMSPTIVLNPAGLPAFVAGSPGGSSIIGTTTQALVAMIDWGLDPQQAANQAKFQNNNSTVTTLESLFPEGVAPGEPGGPPPGTTGLIGPFDVRSLAPRLTELGYAISPAPTLLTSGLGLVARERGTLVGGADPRREGAVAGR